MASISNQKNGHRIIQFMGADGRRRSIRLGKVPKRFAESVKVRVEHLVTAALTGHSVDDDTIRWVAKLDNRMTEKLSRAGLIASRPQNILAEYLDGYIAKRNIKKSKHAEELQADPRLPGHVLRGVEEPAGHHRR